jgi:hypothetical protein
VLTAKRSDEFAYAIGLLTVFFIVAGCAFLWLNLRPKAPRIVLTKTDDPHQSTSTEHPRAKPHPLLDELQRHLSEADRGGQSHDSARRVLYVMSSAPRVTMDTALNSVTPQKKSPDGK